ncbi:MAG: alcohol dehydrogenase [Caulobacteraceae bacterium]|nr:alcohol dehydrogenase [Caulobacteraceae bacterium]
MRASVFQAAGAPLAVIDTPDPGVLAGDLLIKVAYSGVCGTDLHLTQSGIDSPLGPGAILGHEFAGEVIEAGREAATRWHVGERVTVMPYRACPACGALCKDGLDIICPSVAYLGIALPGGNAQYVAVGAAQALRLPEPVDLMAGAMVEPLAVGLHAVRKAGQLLGARVLVIGAGPVGQAVAIFARVAGAAGVVVSEPRAPARRRAEAMGATATLDPRAGDVGEAFADLAGGAPEVVFECVGTPGMIAESIRLAPLFGRVIVVGACMELDHFRPMLALTKELTLTFVLGHTRGDFQFVIDALAQGRIDPAPLVTEVAGFERFPQAFEDLRSGADSCKLLLKPN